MATPEGKLKREICDYLKSRGLVFFVSSPLMVRGRKNTSPYSSVGVPDIVGILPNSRFFCIEVKSEKGILSSKQSEFISRVVRNGGLALVARSLDEVVATFMGF